MGPGCIVRRIGPTTLLGLWVFSFAPWITLSLAEPVTLWPIYHSRAEGPCEYVGLPWPKPGPKSAPPA